MVHSVNVAIAAGLLLNFQNVSSILDSFNGQCRTRACGYNCGFVVFVMFLTLTYGVTKNNNIVIRTVFLISFDILAACELGINEVCDKANCLKRAAREGGGQFICKNSLIKMALANLWWYGPFQNPAESELCTVRLLATRKLEDLRIRFYWTVTPVLPRWDQTIAEKCFNAIHTWCHNTKSYSKYLIIYCTYLENNAVYYVYSHCIRQTTNKHSNTKYTEETMESSAPKHFVLDGAGDKITDGYCSKA